MGRPSVLVAGATGAVGRPLVERLVARGYEVYGLTRSASRGQDLGARGCRPVVADVYRPRDLARALGALPVAAVVHLLTDLPFGLPPARMDEGRRANARMRSEGTANLWAALGPRRPVVLVAQSIAFCHGSTPGPFDEADPVENESIREYEALLLSWEPQATILRYGPLTGPGTGTEVGPGLGAITADRAAQAALLALERPVAGTFHVCGPGPYRTDKARSTWPALEV